MSKRKWDEPGSAGPEGEPAKVQRTDDVSSKFDAAAEIAARIAAQYGAGPVKSEGQAYKPGQREANDPEFIKDIEINDIRNRYLLTKGPTQQQILADTGANVTTKGVWYPDKAMATDRDPPLYLHITGLTQEILDKGIDAVQKLIDSDLGPLTYQQRDRERDRPERRKWPEEKLPISLETLRNFNVRAKVVGPGGLFVKYIQQETQTRVQIKGQGSGFIETDTGRESEDAMHINVTGPDEVMVRKAATMAEDLLDAVRGEWKKAKDVIDEQMRAQQNAYYAQQQNQYAQYYAQYQGAAAPAPPSGDAPPPPPPGGAAPAPPTNGSAPPPPPPPTGAAPAAPAQPAGQSQTTPEQWTAYWNSLDPAQQAYYTQYYAQAYSAAPAAASGAAPAAAAYTPAATSAPGAQGGSGTYGAVPPPPGL